MSRAFGPRALLAVCAVLAILLAALAVVQYRWSARVAAADAQREKEHLDSAASLFANEFDSIAARAFAFLQNDAWAALNSKKPLTSEPKLLDDVYYLSFPPHGAPEAQRLAADGLFSPVAMPSWITTTRCAALAMEQPPALIAPIYEIATAETHGAGDKRILRTFRWRPDRCFIARINQNYLRSSLVPQLIRRSFGDTAVQEYDFAVVSPGRPNDVLYGAPLKPDLRKRFFSISHPFTGPNEPFTALTPPVHAAVVVQSLETVVRHGESPLADLYGPGILELEVAHKGVPLAAAFERTRRLDMLLSLAVESLLVAAIAFLLIGVRRIQRLADQKMRFVAGVSHELRTPVSAIAMLSRNQADGLVTDPAKVTQYGELIHQQSRRLNEMVEQALQYAGIQSGLWRPAKSEVDLRHIIREAVDARREELAQGGFEVEIAAGADLPPVFGDAKLLRTAFDNLLTNAQKHASGGRWLRVSASYSAAEKEVRIGVEDRGAGIDAADQAEIFEPFSRGKAAVEAQIPGSGLGLSLVRSAAEAHRGSVTLVSEPGRGSTFTMHLPV